MEPLTLPMGMNGLFAPHFRPDRPLWQIDALFMIAAKQSQ